MIEWFVSQVIALIGPIADLGKEKRELADAALKALSEALTETYLYYSALSGGKPRAAETEAPLARLWAAAVVPLRHIDRQLAETCQIKSRYWVDPDTWHGNAEDEMRIGLDLLQGQYLSLLGPNKAL